MGASFLGSSSVNSCATYSAHIICSRHESATALENFFFADMVSQEFFGKHSQHKERAWIFFSFSSALPPRLLLFATLKKPAKTDSSFPRTFSPAGFAVFPVLAKAKGRWNLAAFCSEKTRRAPMFRILHDSREKLRPAIFLCRPLRRKAWFSAHYRVFFLSFSLVRLPFRTYIAVSATRTRRSAFRRRPPARTCHRPLPQGDHI